MEQDIKLKESQEKVLKQMKDFIFDSQDRIFILKGYAGTGKTTLMRFLIKELDEKKEHYKLLSTTGRAAKIMANLTHKNASTIHGLIYQHASFNKDLSTIDIKTASVESTGQLFLVFESIVLDNEDRRRTIYIIDESSMLSDMEEKDITQAKFGSGRLLKELLNYDNLPDSKFIFLGDPCQLPPVLGDISPALYPSYYSQTFDMNAQEATLTEIMRQDNSIIAAGSYIRKLWSKAPENEDFYPGKLWGTLKLSLYHDIQIHGSLAEMEQLYLENIRKNGYNDSIFICKSNAKCLEMSKKIRQQLGFSGTLQKGDLLMVVQNQSTTGLMNGDMVEVVEVGRHSERSFKDGHAVYSYHSELSFREVKVMELFTKHVYTTLLMETLICNEQVNLDSRQQSGLFLDFILRMKSKGINPKKDKEEFQHAMLYDPYLNALRCNYGYAITCHKAQGGEWNSVYIQIPRNITLKPTKSKYQWFYTALTRAKNTVHICKDFFIE